MKVSSNGQIQTKRLKCFFVKTRNQGLNLRHFKGKRKILPLQQTLRARIVPQDQVKPHTKTNILLRENPSLTKTL